MVGRPRKNTKINGPLNAQIKQRMKVLGITEWREFARRFHIGETTLHSILAGRQSETGRWIKPSVDTLTNLAIALELPVHEVLYALIPDAPGATDFIPSDLMRVPIVGAVGAGPGQDAPLEEREVTVSKAFARGRDLRAFEVRGHSMCAGKRAICDGDVIVVDADHRNPVSGQAVVARLIDDSFVVKAYKSDKFGARLQSTNALVTNGTAPYIPLDQVAEVIGVVVKVSSTFTMLD
jgi:repressor LexA